MSGQKFISEAPGSGGERPFCRRLLARWGRHTGEVARVLWALGTGHSNPLK